MNVSSSSGVYFYVQAFGNKSVGGNGVLPFDMERLNIGGGMNLKSGVFTAPKNGTYTFHFSINKNGWQMELIEVYLRRNGMRIAYSTGGPGLWAIPITLQSTLNLKRGDRIDLQKSKNGGITECAFGYCHHFSGWMLEENLEI